MTHEQNWAINESSNVELLLSIYAHSRPDHSGAVFNQTNSTSYNYQMKNPKLLVGVRRAIDSILPRPEILTSQWKLFYCLWNDVQVLMTTTIVAAAAAAITKTTKNKFALTSQCNFSWLFSLSKSKLLGSRKMDIRVARRWSLYVINRVIAMTTYDNFTELRVLVQNVSLSRQTRRRNENNKKKCFTSSSPSTLNHQSILVRVFESFVAIREAALVKFTHSSDQHRSEAITSSRWKVFCRKSERAKSENWN